MPAVIATPSHVLSLEMEQVGIEFELAVLLVVLIFGSSFFAVFEVETPGWGKALKWAIFSGVTLGLYGWVGHWSLAFLAVMAALGTTVHFTWCRKNGIHPLDATPRKKYYERRGWEWRE